MAVRQADGSIRMSDGRIIYADSLITGQDLFEIIPLYAPAPVWPFVSGGGVRSGTPGPRGAAGAPGAPGVQGPQGTNPGVQGPQGNQGALNPDIFAATRVVSLTPGDGTDLTIQDAVDNLPAEGGSIFIKQGTYTLSATITLPDKNIIFNFAASAILDMGSNAFAAFTIPDGLTELRYFVFSAPVFEGDGTPGQDFIVIADTNAFANVLIENPYIENPDTLINIAAYDLSYVRPVRARVVGGWCFPNGDLSTLVKTPNPNNTFAAPAIVTFQDVGLWDESVVRENQKWILDADADLNFLGRSVGWGCSLAAGGGCNGFAVVGFGALYFGDGDFTWNGNSWDGLGEIGASYLNGLGNNSRLVTSDATVEFHPGYVVGIAFKSTALPGPMIHDVYWIDRGSLANPAIEATKDAGAIGRVTFWGTGGGTPFGQGCIKLTGARYTKVHDCHFDGTVTGQTVMETGIADKNCIHDNTGFASGTGNTVNINGNDQVHNNIN